MSMRLDIVADDVFSHEALQVSVCGRRLELLGFTHGKKVAIEEEYGRITVRLIDMDGCPCPAPVEEVPEGLEVVEPVKEVSEVLEVVEPVEEVPEGSGVVEPVESERVEKDLFAKLSSLRKKIASEVKLPPYIIFHDVSLRKMCEVLPSCLEDMAGIKGVGRSKLEKYGKRFLDVIVDHVREQGRE